MKEQGILNEQIKKCGLKSTKSRMAILQILYNNDCPMAAEDIFIVLKNKDIQINLSTVYRTLEALEDAGLVTKIQIMNEDRKLFEYNEIGHRHYLICVTCKKLVTIHDCPLGDYDHHVEEETDFTILGHKLFLYGYCRDCRENGEVKRTENSI